MNRPAAYFVAVTTTVVLPLAARGGPTLVTLASFTGGADGKYPRSAPLVDAAGDVFGTASAGGNNANNYGTVFEVVAGSQSATAVATFDDVNGAYPYAGVAADAAGDLFGTTYGGGSAGDGTVYEVAAGSHAVAALTSFANGTNGGQPRSGLVADGAGNLYGTTAVGGPGGGYGTVFKVAAGSHGLTTVAKFDLTHGSLPMDGVTIDPAGDLFGTTYLGGTYDMGTVFEVPAGSGTVSKLAVLSSQTGDQPTGSVVVDRAGNVYGTAIFGGGAAGDGDVYEVAAGTHVFSILTSFTGANGSYPDGGLTIDAAGDLFGTTTNGGTDGDGTVFEIPAATRSLTTLFTFAGANGQDPTAALTPDAAGDLFGTTTNGGAAGDGTVFELTGTGFVVPEPNAAAVSAAGATATGLVRRRRLGRRRAARV